MLSTGQINGKNECLSLLILWYDFIAMHVQTYMIKKHNARFVILTEMLAVIPVFWDIMSRQMVCSYPT
jgi:hypothetical protein